MFYKRFGVEEAKLSTFRSIDANQNTINEEYDLKEIKETLETREGPVPVLAQVELQLSDILDIKQKHDDARVQQLRDKIAADKKAQEEAEAKAIADAEAAEAKAKEEAEAAEAEAAKAEEAKDGEGEQKEGEGAAAVEGEGDAVEKAEEEPEEVAAEEE